MNNQSSVINNHLSTALPKPLPLQPEELDILTPEGRKTLLEWLETEYYLSKKVHGLSSRWSSEYGPFWVPVIECLADTVTREVWVYAPAQSGKSTLMTGWMGYTVDCDPVPMGLVMPREEDASERVECNVIPMFEENPRLLAHAGGSAHRINIGKMTMFDNMAFYLLFAKSAAAMAGKAICRLGIDEAGKFPAKVAREADPISLGRDRLETFKGRSKLYGATTPVIKDDLADTEWKKGDCCEWWVPCPKCSAWQRPSFWNVKLDKGSDGHLLEADIYSAGGHARYVCPFCKRPWTEIDRWEAICAGKYVPGDCTLEANGHLTGEIKRRTVRSFRITAMMLHPAIQTVDYLAARWAAASFAQKAGDTGPMQAFYNSRLAEVWELREKIPQIAKLASHRGSTERGIVPVGGSILTGAVDVQLDHVWIAVIAWGYQFAGWLIYAGRLETGSTDKVENYEIVRQFLSRRWDMARDKTTVMRLAMAGIDCGYNTDAVYSVCRLWAELPVVPLMGWGEDRMTGRLYRTAKLGEGLVRYDINVDRFKDAIYRQLFIADAPGPGFISFYRDIPDEYLSHCIAEQQVRIAKGRREFLLWQKKDSHAPNHLWDLLVYNRFLAEIAGVPALSNPDAKVVAAPPPAGKPVARRPIRTRY